MGRQLISFGAAFAFLGVLLGAFGAHALGARLSVQSMEIYRTGVQYQLIHALGLLAMGLLAADGFDRRLIWAGRLMAGGIVLFSFSLYALALTGIRLLGVITPLGGVCFLLSWTFLFAWSVSKTPNAQAD